MIMRRGGLLLLALLLLACQSAAQPAPKPAAPAPLPVSGRPVPALAAFDQVMLAAMRRSGATAATLAVGQHGRLLLARGYGWRDEARTQPVRPNTPMRIASLTKPITAAAVRQLGEAGRLRLDAPVFCVPPRPRPGCLLRSVPPGGRLPDARLARITVAHLLYHTGGWDRRWGTPQQFDPLFYEQRTIAAALGRSGRLRPPDIVRYVLGQPLDFTPPADPTDPTQAVYANVGYLLLGQIIAQASGQPYMHAVQQLVPAAQPGRTRPAQRDPREPWYDDTPYTCADALVPTGPPVPCPDGGFAMALLAAAAGLVAPAPALLPFAHAFWGPYAEPPLARATRGCFFHRRAAQQGVLPGARGLLLWQREGVIIVALFNRRLDQDALQAALTAATQTVAWPVRCADDFGDPASGWRTASLSDEQAGLLLAYEQGRYRMRLVDGWASSATHVRAASFALRSAVQLMSDAPGSAGLVFGVSWDAETFARFAVNAQGAFALHTKAAGEPFVPRIDWTASPAVRPAGQPNRLRVVARVVGESTHLALFANGTRLATYTLSGHRTPGRFGLATESLSTAPVEAVYDAFAVRSLEPPLPEQVCLPDGPNGC